MTKPAAFLPFRVDLKPGKPISEQVVYAVERAVLSGLLRPGARFPSIRAISQDLRIHPNTTQKAVSALVDAGFLQVLPGIGTIVASSLPASPGGTEPLKSAAESLVLQAKRQRLDLAGLQRLVEKQWNKLSHD